MDLCSRSRNIFGSYLSTFISIIEIHCILATSLHTYQKNPAIKLAATFGLPTATKDAVCYLPQKLKAFFNRKAHAYTVVHGMSQLIS